MLLSKCNFATTYQVWNSLFGAGTTKVNITRELCGIIGMLIALLPLMTKI